MDEDEIKETASEEIVADEAEETKDDDELLS